MAKSPNEFFSLEIQRLDAAIRKIAEFVVMSESDSRREFVKMQVTKLISEQRNK